MNFTRRDFGKFALGTLPAASVLLSHPSLLSATPRAMATPNSVFRGVQIGCIIPYSYHGESSKAQDLLGYLVTDGISGCEMQNSTAEAFAGAPQPAGRGGGARRGPAPAARRGAANARRAPGPRPQPTPEELAARQKQEAALTKWRLSVPMSKYEALRKLYNDAGVHIYGFKLGLSLTMPDAEYDYAFTVAKTLGANQLTMEHPNGADADQLTDRIGKFAAKHKIMAAYHAHTQATPTYWDKALSQSPYNGINIDVGHYVAAGNHDVLQFLQKHHDRIGSIHLKDRKYPSNGQAGPNMPWGQGDTPLVQILQLMRDQRYTFPGTIELEYPIPATSDATKEVAKCVAYAKHALES